MRNRCNNPNCPRYDDYGGRGIKVCDRWRLYRNFYADMGDKPNEMTLDRIDNNGNYELNNCKWSTIKEQMNNKRNNRLFDIDGHTKTLAQWTEISGLKKSTVSQRFYAYNWSIIEALNTPIGERRISKC